MKQNRTYTFRHFWLDYQSEVIFGLVLSAMLIGSAWLSQYIPEPLFESIMEVGTDTMTGTTMVVACFFAWLNRTHTFLQLLPLLLLGLLDYYVPVDLRWLIALYPIGLFIILIGHIRKYREWCEDNFSTLDDIDVQWIVRYVMMVMMSIEEAKRLMTEQPDLKLQEVAERCGFSSPVVFSRVFTRETGVVPSKWAKVNENR